MNNRSSILNQKRNFKLESILSYLISSVSIFPWRLIRRIPYFRINKKFVDMPT